MSIQGVLFLLKRYIYCICWSNGAYRYVKTFQDENVIFGIDSQLNTYLMDLISIFLI